MFLFAAGQIAGCKTTRSEPGLSPDAKKVGSGSGFQFTAPTDGEMYMVRNGKVEVMRWLAKGSKFEAVGSVPWANPKHDFSEYEFFFKPSRMAQPDK